MRREDAHVANVLRDQEAAAIPDKEATAALLRHAVEERLRVPRRARHREHLLVDVGCEKLDAGDIAQAVHVLAHQHRYGEYFLTRGAAGHPHPNRFVGTAAVKHLRNNLVAQSIKGIGVAEEVRDVDEEIAE